MMETDLNNNSSESQIYEIGYHILPTIAEENVVVESDKIRSIIIDNGGTIISEESANLRVLSYEIGKVIDSKRLSFGKAYFGWIKFELDKEKISKIQKLVEGLPNVLRFIITKTVRENTMHVPKVPLFRREELSDKEHPPEEKVEISQEEIDKSIDELLVNTAL